MHGVDPIRLVRSAIVSGVLDGFSNQPVAVVSAGKAAWPMAIALDKIDIARRGNGSAASAFRIAVGIVAGSRTTDDNLSPVWECFNASHPSPNELSEAAGRRALEIAAGASPEGGLLVLLSGGASSMLAVPAPGLSLQDKMITARALMNAGIAIAELNCVRKHLSGIKGGRLAAAARRTVTLSISDVHGPIADDPAVIGSGPTVGDPTTWRDALEIVERPAVRDSIPASVRSYLAGGANESPKPDDPRLHNSRYRVIGNRRTAANAAAQAARERGYEVSVVEAATSGEARLAGAAFAAEALRQSGAGRLCVIASGETTVHVRGQGRGGRNQEFALGALQALDRLKGPRVAALASAGTDGIDGPTDAAGAIVDTTTTPRAEQRGLRAEAALAANGAYDFFAPLGDLMMWGPTGTNVGDLHAIVAASQ